jgi:hypothetical protein
LTGYIIHRFVMDLLGQYNVVFDTWKAALSSIIFYIQILI